ncbi:MAG: hypothetical protein M1814_001752 [Vezdaea aestivalis]|nr:MAG: hypothetical protein M1814_001752 [Vezdaea aestivalis]
MFDAFNRFISRLDTESPSSQVQKSSDNAYGFQVLKNEDPALEIEPWFDFIVGINGRPITDPSSHLLTLEVRNCASSTLTLALWSAKGSLFRTLLVPVPPLPTPTLSLSLQWAPLSLTHSIWHILSVAPSSPAAFAGILPQSDYIIGSPSGHLQGESGLGELVEDHLDRPLQLWVYNRDYDVTRSVSITPGRRWGGEGALGCEMGFGALHRLPPPLETPPESMGEKLFETEGERFSNEAKREGGFVVPAHVGELRAGSASPAKEGRGARRKGVGRGADGGAMDEYFKEGEEKSKALDHAPAGAKGGAPPPPKAFSGPPKEKGDD